MIFHLYTVSCRKWSTTTKTTKGPSQPLATPSPTHTSLPSPPLTSPHFLSPPLSSSPLSSPLIPSSHGHPGNPWPVCAGPTVVPPKPAAAPACGSDDATSPCCSARGHECTRTTEWSMSVVMSSISCRTVDCNSTFQPQRSSSDTKQLCSTSLLPFKAVAMRLSNWSMTVHRVSPRWPGVSYLEASVHMCVLYA